MEIFDRKIYDVETLKALIEEHAKRGSIKFRDYIGLLTDYPPYYTKPGAYEKAAAVFKELREIAMKHNITIITAKAPERNER